MVIRGEEKGNKEVKIAQVCENYMGHYLYLTAGYYEKIYGDEPEYNAIFFQVPESFSLRSWKMQARKSWNRMKS